MAEKIKTLITDITLDTPTFHRKKVSPTLLNFFYGKNGSGKSTIAKEIGNGTAATWQPGINPSDYDVKVYNEEYIETNIQSYGNIPGVFTITKQNADVKAEIDRRNKEKAKIAGLMQSVQTTSEETSKKLEKLNRRYLNGIWNATEELRKRRYPETQVGYKTDKKKFVEKLELTTPKEYKLEDIDSIYNSSFNGTAVRYDRFRSIDPRQIPDASIIEEPIVGSSSSPFAEFIQALHATDWVRQGYHEYHKHANGKCPYCQQKLPPEFDAQLASCFDDRYEKQVQRVSALLQQYKAAMNGIHSIMMGNMDSGFECELISPYKDKYALLLELARKNIGIIEQKEKEPASCFELDNEIYDVIDEINGLTNAINKKILANNKAFDDCDGQKRKCTEMVWSHMAKICQTQMAVHSSEETTVKQTLTDLAAKGKKYIDDSDLLERKISKLNQQTVNTDAAMQSINSLLKSSGFQGFELRKKPKADYVYELVREGRNGTKEVVSSKAMSEGERHFIAFLYFYHEIMGSQSDDGKVNNKIVIIDDPVSSMDSSALFLIASLTRNVIDVCYNNFDLSDKPGRDDHIRQFFCLTHNPYFFREVTYNRLKDYECASFFEIKKGPGNSSAVEPCTGPCDKIGGHEVNRTPVRNTYDALWEEYRSTDDSIILMNVIRQILEYYFLQICGYKNGNLRADLLDKNYKAFDDGTPEKTNYTIASAMISLLNTGVAGFNDGLYFDSSAIAPDQIRFVFRKIFEVMDQTQHYEMMMRG